MTSTTTDCKLPIVLKGYKESGKYIRSDTKAVEIIISRDDLMRIMKFIDRDEEIRQRMIKIYHDKHPGSPYHGSHTGPPKILAMRYIM